MEGGHLVPQLKGLLKDSIFRCLGKSRDGQIEDAKILCNNTFADYYSFAI
jgi:hypothetical protein